MLTRKQFSRLKQSEVFEILGIHRLIPWDIKVLPATLSDYFGLRLDRLRERFDLRGSEAAKELLIDAVFEEALEGFSQLKIWKGAPLESDRLRGFADYLVALNQDYLSEPYFCVAEAKQDDFVRGMVQCLGELYACDYNNRQAGSPRTVYGVVSNGTIWRFYRFTPSAKPDLPPIVEESQDYTLQSPDTVVGIVRTLLEEASQNR